MITSFILEYFNGSEHHTADFARNRLTVYRKNRRMVYEEFNSYNQIICKCEKQYPKCWGEHFFDILQKASVNIPPKQNYIVDAKESPCRRLKIRYSNNKLQKLNGTVNCRSFSKLIEQELLPICNEIGIQIPTSFGRCAVNSLTAKTFADKWLKIFLNMPSNASQIFEEQMGKDCLSVGFKMDCGEAFGETYETNRLLYSPDGLSSVIENVTDAELLGSAIFSNWRRLTHWSQENGMDYKNKIWFLMALRRLKELVN